MRSLQQLHELGDVKNLLKENPQTEIRGWIRLARMQLERVAVPDVGRSTFRSKGVRRSLSQVLCCCAVCNFYAESLLK
jgi:hypothetical protein